MGGGGVHHRAEERLRKNGCLQALLLRSCGRGGRTAVGPVGDALGVLLLDQLLERVDALEQRCPLDCDICRCSERRQPQSMCDPTSNGNQSTWMIGMLAVNASRASFNSSSLFTEVMLDTMLVWPLVS